MMDDLLRQQYANAQTNFARRQQAGALPDNQLPTQAAPSAQAQPNQTWLLHGPGQPAPSQHFNFEPMTGGAWRIYPPGRTAPAHAPQGTLPVMPPSYDHLKSLGEDLDRQFGQGAQPPVPGPFPKAPPQPRPQPGPTSIRNGPGIPGLR